MVRMDIFVKINELKRQGLKKLQAANHLGIDVKTIRKYWDMTEKDYAEYVRACGERTRNMNPYTGFILDRLKKFPDISSAQVYDWLREAYKDFEPGYSTVRLHVQRLRECEGVLKTAKVRQYQAVEDLPFGRRAQVDMGSDCMTDAYGKKVKVYIFVMSMSASRQKFIYFQRGAFNADSFIYAHRLAFEYFGGRTKEIVYDQDRVLCVSENAGNAVLTEKFRAFQMYCGFSVYLCRGYDPESKGKVEAVVKYVKYNFLRHRVFSGIDTLNSQALEWLDRTGNGLVHNTTKLVPSIAFAEERKHLLPAPAAQEEQPPAAYLVRKDNVVSYRSNRYALPQGTYAPGKQVYVKETEDTLQILSDKGELIVVHPICRLRGQLIRITHPDRAVYSKYKQLCEEVLTLFGNTEQAALYLKRNRELYPRYMKDQFFVFKKTAQEFTLDEITAALDYCQNRELFYATDFRDALVYFKGLETEKYVPDEFTIPLKYSAVTAETRDISAYTKIYGGNK